MNNQFDELAKNLAQSVTRRGALKKFGVGLAGIALATFGLANNIQGKGDENRRFHCKCRRPPYYGCDPSDTSCINLCETVVCPGTGY
jgi:hypothetical protein